MSSVSAPSPSAPSPPAVRRTGAASARPRTEDSERERGEEVIRSVREALRYSGTEEDMIPNFAERIRAARDGDEIDDILMEQVCVMVRRVRREMAEEEAAKKTEEKNASGSRDG